MADIRQHDAGVPSVFGDKAQTGAERNRQRHEHSFAARPAGAQRAAGGLSAATGSDPIFEALASFQSGYKTNFGGKFRLLTAGGSHELSRTQIEKYINMGAPIDVSLIKGW